MKAAILSLVTAAALAASAGTADARPPRYSGGHYSSYRPAYYGNYYRPYYGGYYNYNPGFSFNTGGFGLSIGNGAYPYYSRPYYNGYYNGYRGGYYNGFRGYRGWRW